MILSSFIDPTAFWWALLLPIIILFYFLKLKRDECTIPSTLLWKKVIEDSRVNSLFSKLKENLLLFFQLFLMILLILALARPFLFQKQEEKKIVLLIDRSASMGAIEENNRSRMDRAKEMAEKLVDGLSQNDSMMIISFAKNAAVHQSFTGIKTLLKERIRSLSETQEESRLEDAILIAQSMLQKVASPVLYIITDGAIFDIESIKEKYMLEEGKKKKQIVIPQLLFVGKSTSNAAVLGFEIREDSQGNKQGFVRVQNLGDKPIKGYMEILLNGEAFVQETKSVDLGPGDTSGIFFPNLPIQRGRAETHFVVTQGEDLLALDNHAYFYLQEKRKPSIALVTKGSFFLQKVLSSYESDFSILSYDSYEREEREFDIVVFDGYSPKKALPPGGYLFIHSIPSISGMQIQGEIQASDGPVLNITDQNEFHPGMRFVDMRKLSVSKAMKILWPIDTIPILEAQNNILIGSFAKERQDYIIIGFDLLQSDWPLKLSFPLFMANTMEWLVQKQSLNNIRTGDSISLKIPRSSKEIQIADPMGKKFSILVSDKESPVFSQTNYAGFYDIQSQENAVQTLAVNFFSQQESNITPKNNIFFGEKNASTRDLETTTSEIWRILAYIAFFILLAEWYLYHRRSFSFQGFFKKAEL